MKPSWGNGTDGAVTLTQTSAAPAFATKSGTGTATTFTLTRDIMATNLALSNVNGAFIVYTAGYRIFATGTLTIDATVTVHNNGNPAVGAAGGAATPGGPAGAGGGKGGDGWYGAPGNGSVNLSYSIATTSGAYVVSGGNGARNQANGGGTNGTPGGQIELSSGGTSAGGADYVNAQLTMGACQALDGTKFSGGGGGSSGEGNGVAISGGGGGGAGIVAIYANTLTNNGLISANGGAGGVGGGSGSTGPGCGGGGGGGAVVLVYTLAGSTKGTIQVNGGPGGTSGGYPGSAGQTGLVYDLWQ